jgi:glycosyltransferase involved in cell wall biosynthesis
LIVVERGTDGTLEIAADFAARQAHFQAIGNPVQRGKGHAVRTGMLRARGEHIFYLDADLSVPLREVTAFLEAFAAHPEIAVLIGNRQHAWSRITRAQSWLRRTMGQAFNRLLQGAGLAVARDTQCGFKAFRRAAAQAIFARQKLNGFAFDVEVLLLAQRLGFRIGDLPVEWINSPESKVRIVSDSLRMLRDAARVRRLVDETLRGGGR